MGLSHPLARPTLMFGWVVLLIAALVGDALPPVQTWGLELWVIVAAITCVFFVVTARGPSRLPWAYTALVVVICVSIVVVLIGPCGDDLGRTTEYALGYLNVGVSFLILRGHPALGISSSAVVLGGIGWWSASEGSDLAGQADHLAEPLVTLAGFVMLYLIARHISGSMSRTIEQQLSNVAALDALRSRSLSQRRALSEIPSLVVPLLQRIAAGETLTAEFHAEVAAADEVVRNHLRGDVPFHLGFLSAVSEARRSGVSVRLIGSEETLPTMSDGLAEQLGALLMTDEITEATIRFPPRLRGATTTLLIQGPGLARRYEFDPQGLLLREPA